MLNAIKSDLVEFVTTLQEDGTKVVSKVMGDEDEGEEEDESLILQEKKIADLKRSYESYGNPIKESNQQEYTKYLKKFDMSDFGGYIAEVFDEYPEVSRFYAELVPIKITPEEFWSRYELHCNTSSFYMFVVFPSLLLTHLSTCLAVVTTLYLLRATTEY